MSAKIERAYKNDPSGSVVIGEEMKYKIDFKTTTEKCLDPSENEIMKVYRRPCEGRGIFRACEGRGVFRTLACAFIRSKLAEEQ